MSEEPSENPSASGVGSKEWLCRTEVHEALSAVMLAVHSIHATMAGTQHFNRGHLEYDAVKIDDAIKKVGKLKRHNEKGQR